MRIQERCRGPVRSGAIRRRHPAFRANLTGAAGGIFSHLLSWIAVALIRRVRLSGVAAGRALPLQPLERLFLSPAWNCDARRRRHTLLRSGQILARSDEDTACAGVMHRCGIEAQRIASRPKTKTERIADGSTDALHMMRRRPTDWMGAPMGAPAW